MEYITGKGASSGHVGVVPTVLTDGLLDLGSLCAQDAQHGLELTTGSPAKLRRAGA